MKANKRAETETMKKFGLKRLVESQANYQYYLDRTYIDSLGLDYNTVKTHFIHELNKDEDVLIAFDNAEINAVNLPAEFKEMFQKGLIKNWREMCKWYTNQIIFLVVQLELHMVPCSHTTHIYLYCGWDGASRKASPTEKFI